MEIPTQRVLRSITMDAKEFNEYQTQMIRQALQAEGATLGDRRTLKQEWYLDDWNYIIHKTSDNVYNIFKI